MNLFEAAEAIGVRREDLVTPLGLDAGALVDPKLGIEWDTLVAVLAQLSKAVGGDVERIREVGRKMPSAPSYVFLQTIARTVFSLRSLYEAGERWVAPASVPHLVMKSTFTSDDRMHFRCSIPEPYAASAPYFHIFEGLLCAVPTMLGLPPATIITTHVTPRQLDIVLALPPSRSALDRMKRRARATMNRRRALGLLEAQRREIAEGLEAVQRSTSEIQSLFDRLPDLVVIHREGAIVWLNRAAMKTFGYEDAGELIGRRLVDLFDPSSHDLALERVHGEVVDVSAPDLAPAKLVSRDRGHVLVEVSPAEAVRFGGKDARLFVARDVTERKRLQEQLSISDRLASIGMLAAGVAHEVNNPLAYVLNNIEIARRELLPLGAQTEQSREALAIALEGVDRIRTIIRDLLTLARVDDAALGPIDVRAVVQSTLALATHQISERAELVCAFEPVPPAIGTASRLGQVLLNLLANALEALPPSSRTTNVLRVVIRRSASGGILIEVGDNGVGISPEHAPHVFEPFFTTKALGKGTGLGLAISQRLIAEIGGNLTFESASPHGTTFRVVLRAAELDSPS